MGIITELLVFLGLLNTYKRNFKVQNASMAKTIEPEIAQALETNDGSIGDKDIAKIRTYYGNAVPAILGEGYALLREKPLSDQERETLTFLGGLTGLFDDLFDEKKIEGERLLEMIQNPKEEQAKSSFELLFLKFYLRALSLAENPQLVIDYLVKGYYAQMGSLEQTEPNISQGRIAEVTREKGGVFLQFYRAGMSGMADEKENTMLYNIGAVGQLENDIFDVYKDYKDNIKTLPTTANSVEDLKRVYLNWINKYENSLSDLKFNPKAKSAFERFTRILYLRGRVCLSQYKKLEAESGGEFKIQAYSRKQLICDMSKLKNQLALMGYYSRKNHLTF